MRFKSLGLAVVLGVTPVLFTTSASASLDDDGVAFSPALAALQAGLAGRGIALESAELLIAGDGWDGVSPHTLIALNRTHQLSSQFVENDPRRDSPPDTITYLIDQSDGVALALNATNTGIITVPNSFTEPLLDLSMAQWDNYQCNGPAVLKIADDGSDPDVVDGLISPAFGIGTPRADITHAGWLPGSFFNLVAPGGSSFILGATFTLVFIDGSGNPTDLNGDGRADVAFREIYYNRAFGWLDGTGSQFNIDIPSVAIHEAGHAFGLAHFGKVFQKPDGDIRRSPAAIMNAVYIAPDREIRGADTASFCQIWANVR